MVSFLCSLKHMDKQAIPSLLIVRDPVWVGVGGKEHGMQRMIAKQELFDGKHMGCLGIDGNLVDDHIQNMLDFAGGKLRSPLVIIWVCSKNEDSISIEGPHRHGVHLCSR